MKRYYPKSSKSELINPDIAGWSYSGLAIFTLTESELVLPKEILQSSEGALIPLAGQDIRVIIDGEDFNLQGRAGVFQGSSDWIYIAPGSEVRLIGKGEVALATARAEKKFASTYVPKVHEIEIRGAGSATREIRPFMHPDIFPNAVRLNAVEVITPDGNTSSYPPHRHDGIDGCPFHNEEIYYFRIGEIGKPHGTSNGFGIHRTYSAPEDKQFFDETISVRDGDIYLVDRGYHGPCVAMPGYPMYYLNVLAGPATKRTMGFCDDPTYGHIRESWKIQQTDQRVPWRMN